MISRDKQPRRTLKGPRLSWKAYFERFCREHGMPIKVKGRLLFPDGWTYSSSDYAGPEWPPPQDQAELRKMQLAYWTTRRKAIARLREGMAYMLRSLESLQRGKDVPLQEIAQAEQEDGTVKAEARDINIPALAFKLGQLDDDLRQCDKELGQLIPREQGAVHGEEQR